MAILSAAVAAYLYWDYTSHFELTDDVFIAARQFAIAPQVAGYVTAVPVTDNQHVEKGGVIAQIDQRDYRAALEQANAQVTAAKAGIANVDAQIATQNAQIGASQAQVAQAQANLELAQVTWGRDKPLVKQGWATAQQGTTDVQGMKAQQAAVDSAQATLEVAQRQIDTLKAQRASAEASLAQAEAQRDQAQLNLGYTTVTADQPGRVVNLTGAGSSLRSPAPTSRCRTERDLGRRELQGDPARPHAAGATRRHRDRRLPGTRLPRPCRQRPARLRPGLLTAAA